MDDWYASLLVVSQRCLEGGFSVTRTVVEKFRRNGGTV